MGFPPADEPHSKRGASERGAPGGKPRRGKPQPPASPPRLKPTGRASRREAARGTTARPQPRKERDNASSRWRGPWARLIPPRAQRADRKTYLHDATSPGKFPRDRGNPFGETDYGTDAGTSGIEVNTSRTAERTDSFVSEPAFSITGITKSGGAKRRARIASLRIETSSDCAS